jgi:hypothetical protein
MNFLRALLWRIPIRLPGGLSYQFGQWYAQGKNCRGSMCVGTGRTRTKAQKKLAELLQDAEGYEASRSQ